MLYWERIFMSLFKIVAVALDAGSKIWWKMFTVKFIFSWKTSSTNKDAHLLRASNYKSNILNGSNFITIRKKILDKKIKCSYVLIKC